MNKQTFWEFLVLHATPGNVFFAMMGIFVIWIVLAAFLIWLGGERE